jgi:hypothetical protein
VAFLVKVAVKSSVGGGTPTGGAFDDKGERAEMGSEKWEGGEDLERVSDTKKCQKSVTTRDSGRAGARPME